MQTKALRAGLTTALLVGAIGALFYSTLAEETAYYKHVDEVMVDPEIWYGRRLQLHGRVVQRSIERRRDSLDYRFRIESNGRVVSASYTGIVPDTFKGGSEVVVKGRLGPDGFQVEPGGVMAKCPSKYEPDKTR